MIKAYNIIMNALSITIKAPNIMIEARDIIMNAPTIIIVYNMMINVPSIIDGIGKHPM